MVSASFDKPKELSSTLSIRHHSHRGPDLTSESDLSEPGLPLIGIMQTNRRRMIEST